MAGDRRDLMGECNVGHHPLDIFTAECCANCMNPECTRSLHGKMKFDQRITTWFPKYFGDAGMSQDDPRYAQIAGQRFMIIDPGLVGVPHEVRGSSAWVDPRDLAASQPLKSPIPQRIESQTVARTPTSVPGEVEVPEAQPEPVPEPMPPTRRDIPAHLLLANTPALAGQMLGRHVSTPAAPKDPWSAAPPEKSDVPVVAPGASVKMGGSGV